MIKPKKTIRFIYDGNEQLISFQELRRFRKKATDLLTWKEKITIDTLIDTVKAAGGDKYAGELIGLELPRLQKETEHPVEIGQ